jgi:hypothetical protein
MGFETFPSPKEGTDKRREGYIAEARRRFERWAKIGIFVGSTMIGTGACSRTPESPQGAREAVVNILGEARAEVAEHYGRSRVVEIINQETYLSDTERTRLEEELDYLQETFPESTLADLAWAHEQALERRSEVPDVPKVTGWEQIGLSNHLLSQLWRDGRGYPYGMLNGQVDAIVFTGREGRVAERYNVDGPAAAEVVTTRDTLFFFTYDTLERISELDDPVSVIRALDQTKVHEAGHTGDPFNDNYLSMRQGVSFLHDIGRAFERPDRFRDPTGYVERIHNGDPRIERLDKVIEWWATLNEYSFMMPELLATHPTEQSLVRKWKLREDPEFDFYAARDYREGLYQEIANNLERGDRVASR